jgi:hypothetical protein
MKVRVLAMLCASLAATGLAAADTVVVDDQVAVKQTSLVTPKRGSTMADVEKQFGAPVERHPAVSSPGTAHQPPITRWDYQGFSVIFERDRVIDSVVTG